MVSLGLAPLTDFGTYSERFMHGKAARIWILYNGSDRTQKEGDLNPIDSHNEWLIANSDTDQSEGSRG
jgi:hypothetical protein